MYTKWYKLARINGPNQRINQGHLPESPCMCNVVLIVIAAVRSDQICWYSHTPLLPHTKYKS